VLILLISEINADEWRRKAVVYWGTCPSSFGKKSMARMYGSVDFLRNEMYNGALKLQILIHTVMGVTRYKSNALL